MSAFYKDAQQTASKYGAISYFDEAEKSEASGRRRCT